MPNPSTKSKSNLNFKSKTKPNKLKPAKKIFLNSQKCQTPAQLTPLLWLSMKNFHHISML